MTIRHTHTHTNAAATLIHIYRQLKRWSHTDTLSVPVS